MSASASPAEEGRLDHAVELGLALVGGDRLDILERDGVVTLGALTLQSLVENQLVDLAARERAVPFEPRQPCRTRIRCKRQALSLK